MNFFFKLISTIVFVSLVVGYIQPVFAIDSIDILNPVSIKDSEYQFHLQVIITNTEGELVSVTESTHGYYIPHDVTDNAFDNYFGEKEIITIDTTTYEKVVYYETYNLDLPGKLMFFIPVMLEVPSAEKVMIIEANIFQAFVPFVYLEGGDVINTKWTILRIID